CSLAAGNDPLVLGAVPIKSELIREVQQVCGSSRIFDVVMSHWRAASEAVREADEITVLGYSFPREDQYGRFLMQERVSKRSKPIESIEYYDVDRNVIHAIAETFFLSPSHAAISWKGPVTSAFP